MTDWTQMISGDELESAARERNKSKLKITGIKPSLVSGCEDEGYSTVTINKSGRYTMEKDKPYDEVFENEVWMVFYKMGFKYLNKDNTFKVDLNGNTKQIDILAIDEETCVIVECKASKTFEKSVDFKKELESMHGYYQDLVSEIKSRFGKNLKFKHIFATKNYLITDESNDAKRMESFNITYFDYDTVDYYDKLTNHLGTAARYQLLGNLFPGQEIKSLDTKVPAIKGSMGGYDYYTFLIEPEKLLKLSYVLHRNKANHLMMPTYQRLIKKERLKAVRNFVNEGGYFPNSLVVSIDDDKIKFEPASQSSNTDSKIGMLYLPNKYKSIYVIDGQHRLYGYSDSNYSKNNVIPVVAFPSLPPEKQVAMFMEINENQKAVSKSLRNTLNADLLWKSKDPKKRTEALRLKITEALGERKDSPLYERIIIGEDSPNSRRCITTDYLSKALKASSFFNDYDKNGIKRQGTFDKSNNDLTLPRIMKYLIYCFDIISKGCSSEWDKDADGCLAINNTAQALIRIFNDILEITLKEYNMSVVDDVDDICNKCRPMLDTFVDVINSMPSESLEKIKGLRGAAAEKGAWRALQLPLNTREPKFINDDLQNYIDDNCLDNVVEADSMICDIENELKSKFKTALEKIPNWLTSIVPQSVSVEIAQKLAKENVIRKFDGQSLFEVWDIISFDDFKKIETYSTNWTDFAQDIMKGTINDITKKNANIILTNLNTYKIKVNNEKSLTKSEFEQLESYYKNYVGGVDADN